MTSFLFEFEFEFFLETISFSRVDSDRQSENDFIVESH